MGRPEGALVAYGEVVFQTRDLAVERIEARLKFDGLCTLPIDLAYERIAGRCKCYPPRRFTHLLPRGRDSRDRELHFRPAGRDPRLDGGDPRAGDRAQHALR